LHEKRHAGNLLASVRSGGINEISTNGNHGISIIGKKYPRLAINSKYGKVDMPSTSGYASLIRSGHVVQQYI
jgi:hypothetical protein